MAFQSHGEGIVPVFAQQSAREMDRIGRLPQQVIDDATFGCLQAGWDRAVGADADHLKSVEDIDRCLAAGFTSFTIDPGDLVQTTKRSPEPADLHGVPWDALEDDLGSLIRRYSGRSMVLADEVLRFEEADVLLAVAKYGRAVAHASTMYRHLMDRATSPVEVEIAVDESGSVTSPIEHVFLAEAMTRLGMRWVGFAPRFVGEFGKGVPYRGDLNALAVDLVRHAAIARRLGPYKLSLHSGSDKYEIYEMAREATGGLVHLKTSGTSYLEALRIAATHDPRLFREIYGLSRENYGAGSASYPVSADVESTPAAAELRDDQLVELLALPDSRQVLHVGFGAVLTNLDGKGRPMLRERLRSLIGREAATYSSNLREHIGRHLRPFSAVTR